MGIALLPIADSSAPIYAKPVLYKVMEWQKSCIKLSNNEWTVQPTNNIIKIIAEYVLLMKVSWKTNDFILYNVRRFK